MSAGLYITNTHKRKRPFEGRTVMASKQDTVTEARDLHCHRDDWSCQHLNQDLGKKEVAMPKLETEYFRQREELGKYPNQGTNLAEG